MRACRLALIPLLLAFGCDPALANEGTFPGPELQVGARVGLS